MAWPAWVIKDQLPNGNLAIGTKTKDGTVISVECNEADPPLYTRKVMLHSLGGAVFEHEHPGQWGQLQMRVAKCVVEGQELTPEDAKLLARLEELTKL